MFLKEAFTLSLCILNQTDESQNLLCYLSVPLALQIYLKQSLFIYLIQLKFFYKYPTKVSIVHFIVLASDIRKCSIANFLCVKPKACAFYCYHLGEQIFILYIL